jgi:hypothetical protein
MKKSILIVGLGMLAGCDVVADLLKGGDGPPPRACTAIGCSTSFNATISPRGGEFPSGTHEVVITAEGSPVRTCTFKFPFAGPLESAECRDGGGVMVMISPLQTCTTTNHGDTVSHSCVPVPGKFEERLSVPGLSPKVRVTQRTLEGGTYLDREATPTYEDVFPNGKECGAVCKQASARWDF